MWGELDWRRKEMMAKGYLKRGLVVFLAAALSLVGIVPGTVMAAGDVSPCTLTTNPFFIAITAPAVLAKYQAPMDIQVAVSNCTTADWDGNVHLQVSPWNVGDWCAPNGDFGVQALSVRAGDTRSLTFKGVQPECLGIYQATATAFDTAERATNYTLFSVYAKIKTKP
jgi:hypothetical protein